MESVQIQSPETGPDKPAAPATASVEGRPAFIPDKFWNAQEGKVDYEGLAKSYAELEKRSTPPPPQTPDEKVAADKAAAEAAVLAAKSTVMSAIPGVSQADQQTATQELQETGTLSDKTFDALAKAGYDKETVNRYIRGVQADQESGARTVTEMKGIVGGEAQYTAMTAWMTNSLTPAEIAGYNKAVSSQDNAVIELAVRGMHSKYTNVNGSDPSLLGGSTSSGLSNGPAYASVAQLTADQRNPLYKSDPAFRKMVSDKLERSNIL